MTDALFDVPTPPSWPAGECEKALRAQLDDAFAAGRLIDLDRPLAQSALVLARTLDTADRVGGLKGGYLAAQAQPPFQKACHALRLPAELGPPVAVPPAGNSQGGLRELLGDAFGTPE